jgi:hypothetical protein
MPNEVMVPREDGVPPLVVGELGAGPRTLREFAAIEA